MQTVKEKMRRWKRARKKALNMKYKIKGIKKGSPIDIACKLLGCALAVWTLIWFWRLYIIVAQGAL